MLSFIYLASLCSSGDWFESLFVRNPIFFVLFQLVPLHATLTVPQFSLSKESLDFGVCLVGQTRELQLMLSNLTSSHTHWSISQGQ